MKRVIVLGCPGSGKSTFAASLQKCTWLPLIHLDNIWWKQDKTHISRSEFDKRLAAVIHMDSWIIDGDYSRTYEVRIKACDTIFFLDYGETECMRGICERVGKKRPDLPWTENSLDSELVAEVKSYRNEKRPVVLDLLLRYPEKEKYCFHSREEAEHWLSMEYGIISDTLK